MNTQTNTINNTSVSTFDTIKTTLNMAWPAMVESFFIAFTGLIDSLMVSSLGEEAVAAVGLTTQPKFFSLSLFIATNVSLSALVARRRGSGDKREANTILATALCFIVVMAAIICSLAYIFANELIHFCGSEPGTHASATLYFRIIIAGMIFNIVSMTINAAQRGAGRTKIAMRTNVTSNAINVVLNYLLIQGHFGFPALGIRGAALATVLGTVVAAIMSLVSLYEKDNFVSIPYIFEEKIKPSFKDLANIVKIGYSIFLEQILMRIGFMATAIMAAKQGTAAMAAHQVGMNILSLSFAFGDGLQSAAVALIGQSLGQENPDMAKKYGRNCRMIGGAISAILAIIYLISGTWIYSLFFDKPEIVNIGTNIIHVIIFIILFQIAQVIYMGCLRGAGDTNYTAFASTVSVTIVRTICSYFFCYTLGFGIIGIWFGILSDQISRYTFSMLRFRAGKWVKIKI